MEQIINLLVELVVVVATVIIIPQIKKWLEKKFTNEELKIIETITKYAVYSAEQTIRELNGGAIRKEQVIQVVTEYCLENNIAINSKVLDNIIEAIVKQMNDENK